MSVPFDEVLVPKNLAPTMGGSKAFMQAMKAGRLLLESAGEDLDRDGIKRTPERFAKAMKYLTSGYSLTPEQAIGEGIFDSESSGLVTVKDIEFYSLCEHHMLPFWGKISVAYYPNRKILGLSKIPRVVEVFARRFQVQERLTSEVAHAIFHSIQARAVAARADASHLCMMMRGVEKQCSHTLTESHVGLENLTPMEQTRLWDSLK
jgi:GTP cyclohydrolase I